MLITAIDGGLAESMKAESSTAFSGLATDAEAAGSDAGLGLRKGVEDGSKGLEDDLAHKGEEGGSRFSKGLSGGLSKLGNMLSNTGLPGIKGFGEGLAKAGEQAEGLEGKSSGLTQQLSKLGGAALVGVGVAAAGVAVEGIHLADSMQQATTAIATSAGISVSAAQSIGNAFLGTAGQSEFSGIEIAKAFSGVAGQLKSTEGRALSTAQAMQVMNAASDLATAKQIDLGTATSTVAGVMQSFQLKTKDAASVADILFNASNATGQGVDTLGAALEKVKSKMGAFAPPIGTLSGLLVDMTNHGETGRAAMSALGSVFTGLITPIGKLTSSQQAIVTAQKAAGVSFETSKGQLKPFGDIVAQVSPLIKGMGDAQATATLQSLGFGSSSAKLVSTIQAGPAAFQAAVDSTTKQGSASAAAAKQAQTFSVEMKTLGATFEDIVTKIGQYLIPIVTKLGKIFLEVTNYVLKHKDLLIALGVVIGTVLTTIIGVFVVNKMAAFGKSFMEAGQNVEKFVAKLFTSSQAAAATSAETAASVEGVAASAESTSATTTAAFDETQLSFEGLAASIEAESGGIAAGLDGIGIAADDMAAQVDASSGAADVGLFAMVGGWLADAAASIAAAAGEMLAEWPILAIVAVLAILGAAIYELVAHWSAVWGFIKSIALDAWHFIDNDIVHPIVAGFEWVVNMVKQHWELLVEILIGPVGWIIAAWQHFHDQIIGFFTAVWDFIKSVWDDISSGASTLVTDVVGFFAALPGDIINFFKSILQEAENIVTGIYNFFAGLPMKIVHAIENGAGAVKNAINSLLPVGGGVLSSIGLATGGIVTRPTLAVVGEAGPEAVIPLSQLGAGGIDFGTGRVGTLPPTAAAGSGGGGVHVDTMVVNGPHMTPEQLVKEMGWQLTTGALVGAH